jgi:arsenite methyltransferase
MTMEQTGPEAQEVIREQVRKRYGQIAAQGGCCSSSQGTAGCCGSSGGSCGGEGSQIGLELGYSKENLASLPAGADLGLGCGNPAALASLQPGQTVLDLGSGAGIDCFLAAQRVGSRGHVIGVDMTPEMVSKARENARWSGVEQVEFRLGEIEHLPVADRSVDVILSNCVINLAPDKGQVYREAFRVLRPGGQFVVSDVVATRPISEEERKDAALWSSCSSGALEVSQLQALLEAAGFREVQIHPKVRETPLSSLAGQASIGVVSADIRAWKPG